MVGVDPKDEQQLLEAIAGRYGKNIKLFFRETMDWHSSIAKYSRSNLNGSTPATLMFCRSETE
jgi:hypothetical protein